MREIRRERLLERKREEDYSRDKERKTIRDIKRGRILERYRENRRQVLIDKSTTQQFPIF